MKKIDLVIIGGGSAGMAAAIQAKNEGIADILILEKDNCLGGILNQCIHNGFGLTEFKEELTGPEYLSRFANEVKTLQIPYKLNTTVLNISNDKVVAYTNKEEGTITIQAKAIVFAVGCYERGAGAIMLPGDRPAGVITAGTAQKYLNIHGFLCGKRIVILGSGDIGLIMARRMTLEGAKVICVAEIMPYSNGLNRNIAQCLTDYDIPLYLSTTVSKVIGKERLEKIILSKVDEKLNIIPNTEVEIECDTLLLSVGLIPYVDLANDMGVQMSSTKGPVVDENMMSNIEGVFACGNCLHVHDVVDFVTEEGRNAGHGAAKYLQNLTKIDKKIKISPKDGISYVVPQFINKTVNEDFKIKFRVKKPISNVYVIVECNEKVLYRSLKPILIPSEMVMINIKKEVLDNINDEIIVRLEEKQ